MFNLGHPRSRLEVVGTLDSLCDTPRRVNNNLARIKHSSRFVVWILNRDELSMVTCRHEIKRLWSVVLGYLMSWHGREDANSTGSISDEKAGEIWREGTAHDSCIELGDIAD